MVVVMSVVRRVDITLGADVVVVVVVVAVISAVKVGCSSCYARFQRARML